MNYIQLHVVYSNRFNSTYQIMETAIFEKWKLYNGII